MDARLASASADLPGAEGRSLGVGQRGLPDHDGPGGGIGGADLRVTDLGRQGERPGADLR